MLFQDGEKSENGVRGQAVLCGKGPDPEKGAVDNAVSVDDKQFFSWNRIPFQSL
jgi:hypothetical protein